MAETADYLLRLWYARDLATPLGRVAGVKDNVDSLRVGVDAVLKGPPVKLWGKDWRLSCLLFGYYEDLVFSQTSAVAGPFSIEFSSFFAGGGIGLTW